MNGSEENSTHLSFMATFVAMLVFSALATESFLAYLLMRGRFVVVEEAFLVGLAICISFSALGQKITKIQDSQRWIFFISAIAVFAYYRFFYFPKIISLSVLGDLFIYVSLTLAFGYFILWELLNSAMENLQQRKIANKAVFIVVGVSSVIILSTYIAYSHHQAIMSFLDSHPWVVGVFAIVASIIMGVFIGRRTKD